MPRLHIGQQSSVNKTFSHDDIERFAALSGDDNPIHLNDEFAKQSTFGKRVVHGMLVSSLFSGLLGNKLPGQGTVYLGQNIQFKAPVFIDDTVTATVEVTSLREDKPIAVMSTRCVNALGTVVIEGDAVVQYAP